jgi:hypothetical protein
MLRCAADRCNKLASLHARTHQNATVYLSQHLEDVGRGFVKCSPKSV